MSSILMTFTWMVRRWFLYFLMIPHSWIGECKLRRYSWRLNKALDSAKKWFQVNKLKPNNTNTQVILICPWDATSWSLLGCWVLGLMALRVCSGLHKIIKGHPSFLRKLAWAITTDHLLKIYHALLFHSHVANGVLREHASACIDILLLQNNIRIASANWLEHCKPLQKSLNFHFFQPALFWFTYNVIKQNIGLFLNQK